MDFSKMDFKKLIDGSEIKKTLSRLENIAALSLVLFFFFPWVSLGPLSVNGVGLASEQPLLFLAPLLGFLIVFIRPICQIAIVLKSMKLATAALIIVVFILAIMDGAAQVFSLGVYLTAITGIIIILGTLNIVQLPNAQSALESCDVEEPTDSTEA